VFLAQVSLLLVGQQGLEHFCFPFGGEDCANFTPTPEQNAILK